MNELIFSPRSGRQHKACGGAQQRGTTGKLGINFEARKVGDSKF